MADRKISDLTALTAPASGDYLPIVDISEAAAANKNKRITIEELFRGVPLGTAAAPSIAIEGDENTGIYSPGADQLAISTNGVGRLFVDASGNVGVGTASEPRRLHVSNGYSAATSIDGSIALLVTNNAGANDFAGVGIIGGGTSGGSFIHFGDTANAGIGRIGYFHSDDSFRFNTNGNERLRITSTGTVNIVGAGTAGSTQAVSFNGSAPVNSLVVDSSGRCGIGTSVPGSTLHIEAAGNTVEQRIFTSDNVLNATASLTFGTTPGTRSKAAIRLINSNTGNGSGDLALLTNDGSTLQNRLYINSSGLIGIGTTSPGAPLHILTSSDGVEGFRISNGSNSGRLHFTAGATSQVQSQNSYLYLNAYDSYPIVFGTVNTERARIDTSGRFGIGTTSPVCKLQVGAGNTSPDSSIAKVNTGDANVIALTLSNWMGSATSYGPKISFDNSGRGSFELGCGNGINDFYLGNGSTRYWTVDSSGRFGIGASAPAQLLHLKGSGDVKLLLNSTNNANDRGIYFATSTDNEVLGYIKQEYSTGLFEISSGSGTYGSGIGFRTGGVANRVVIDSSGRVGIGTTSPGAKLEVAGSAYVVTTRLQSNFSDPAYYTDITHEAQEGLNIQVTDFGYPATQVRLRRGNVGIGTTSPAYKLDVTGGGIGVNTSGGTAASVVFNQTGVGVAEVGVPASENALTFKTWTGAALVERARIDSSGRLLVGTSTAQGDYTLQIQGDATAATAAGCIYLRRGLNTAAIGANVGADLGKIQFGANDGTVAARIQCLSDATWGSTSDTPGALTFSTTADGASSPTERMRITNDGQVRIGQTTSANPAADNIAGTTIGSTGAIWVSRDGDVSAGFNRKTSDGSIISFYQDGVIEGSISVSGTTVSYNGAHLSRWSQLPSGAERIEILRGTVLSNIDEMCEWGDEDNEQLNRMKVSDVEGDKNVSGVFQAWDDDDDTYTNDFYCAMTGDFIIRIAQGVTVERGDLLMSAGDGTAKPQDDDIIRSKTIAKVTSTNVSCTYDDGSYCVPCVLMAC